MKKKAEQAPIIPKAADKKEFNQLSIVGFVIACVGMIGLPVMAFESVLFGVVSLVLSIISLAQINRRPDKYRGKGLAVAGIVISAILVCIMAFFAYLLLTNNFFNTFNIPF